METPERHEENEWRASGNVSHYHPVFHFEFRIGFYEHHFLLAVTIVFHNCPLSGSGSLLHSPSLGFGPPTTRYQHWQGESRMCCRKTRLAKMVFLNHKGWNLCEVVTSSSVKHGILSESSPNFSARYFSTEGDRVIRSLCSHVTSSGDKALSRSS